MESFPTPAEVDRIVAMTNPVVRNLMITQCYYELSSMMIQKLGAGANWCTFATWASKQAGQTIRHEDLERTLLERLQKESAVKELLDEITHLLVPTGLPREKVTSLAMKWLTPKGVANRAGDAVARGNLKVFAEIGREFARFGATCLGDLQYNEETIVKFCNELRPGDPPDGQQFLRQAFVRYYRALFEKDDKKRAEYMFMANLEIGYHEQTRLQPEIAEALNASLAGSGTSVWRFVQIVFPYRIWLIQFFWKTMRAFGRPTPLDLATERFTSLVREQIRRFLTKYVMEIHFPDGPGLRLGKDLKTAFAPLLQQLDSQELIALLRKIDPTPDDLLDSGTRDWANLPDRLHFIVDMFRCYHQRPSLAWMPFDEQQLTALQTGKIPGGML